MTAGPIRRHFTRADQARNPYAYLPFEVPGGTTRIDVVLDYPKGADCIIDLGCADPRLRDFPSAEGFRGWSGGARDCFFIATDAATPGYVHGDIPAGEWRVLLGLYKLPEEGADVAVTISLDAGERKVAPQPRRLAPVREGAGWYKGDLHCHTYHSDAAGSPETLHAAAKQAGLDFLAVADHNTTTQRRYFHPHSSPALVFVRAMEVTTAQGHCNVFGVDDWIDFRMTAASDPQELARLVHARGGLLSINHDKPPIPWKYAWPEADCMEVFHETWMHGNWVTLERWQQRLASGMRLPAIGGSDYHQPADLQPEGPLTLARPTTVLWMEDLSEDNILAAMKSGRGYMTESPTGPHLELTANEHPMGSLVSEVPETVSARVGGAVGDVLVWSDATGEIGRQTIEAVDETLDLAAVPRMFVRCEIVAKASRAELMERLRAAFGPGPLPAGLTEEVLDAQPLRRALSNPIYFEVAE